MRHKIGIMGGTFDPIHIGHLILGETALDQYGLEKVLFMPSGNPPHKPQRDGASDEDRAAMVRLAVEGNAGFEVSLEEMRDDGYTYTRVTLERLTAEHPDTDYYFIMGGDSLMQFETWRDPDRICRMCTIVAAVRDGMSTEDLEKQIGILKKKYNADIRVLSAPNLDISSHDIRSRCGEGRSFRYYVPEPVYGYILREGLYGAGRQVDS